MTVFALIGAKAVYLLFVWLLSAAGGAWMSDRKGYGERLGLTFGLVLTFVGFLIVLLLPGRPGSAWKLDGPLPKLRAGSKPAPAEPSAPSEPPPPEPPPPESPAA
jgi:hypothetical protein